MKLFNKGTIVLFVAFIFTFFSNSYAADSAGDGTHLLNSLSRKLGKPMALRNNGRRQSANLPIKLPGTVESFHTFNFASSTWEQTSAKLVGCGENILIYLEEGCKAERFDAETLISEFDNRIYAQTTRFFGAEKRPGIDNEDRITILLMDIKDNFAQSGTYTSGYFNRCDGYRPDEIASGTDLKSNQREMLYIDIHPSEANGAEFFATIAHELQHLIHFHHDPEEYDWVDEGCAQINTYLCGYGHPRQIKAFQKTPDNSLIAWSPLQMVANYGQTYMWNYYLMQRFLPDNASRETFFRNLVADQETGMASFNKQLKQFNLTFDGAFLDFCIASFVNRPGISPANFGYGKDFADFSLPATAFVESLPSMTRNSVSIWGADLVKVSLAAATDKLRIDFAGDLTTLGNSFSVALAFVNEKTGKVLKITTIDNIKSTTRQNIDIAKVMLPDNNDGYPPPPMVKTQMGHGETDVPADADSLYLIIAGKGPADVPDSMLIWEPKANYRLDIKNIGTPRPAAGYVGESQANLLQQLQVLNTPAGLAAEETLDLNAALHKQIMAEIRSGSSSEQTQKAQTWLENLSLCESNEALVALKRQLQSLIKFNELQN